MTAAIGNMTSTHLIVPEGDGHAVAKWMESFSSGIFIFSGGAFGLLVFLITGDTFDTSLDTSDWNMILISVLGNRNRHLKVKEHNTIQFN